MTTPSARFWELSLAIEAGDAGSLFSHGLRVTRNMPNDDQDAVAAMSLLALGAEKMLKLTIGIDHLRRHGGWPTVGDMKAIGHKVLNAERAAREVVGVGGGTAPGYVQQLLDEVDADPVLPRVLEALDRFGDSGRFYFLDYVGNRPQAEPPPHMLWTDMTKAILAANAEILSAVSGLTTHVHGRKRLNLVIAGSLTRWWEAYLAAWRTGVIGERGKRLARELDLRPGAGISAAV